MTKKQAMEWVRALRSGKYKQGEGAMSRNNRFCCLGVLCEINKKHLDVVKVKTGDKRILYNTNSATLPNFMQKKFKISPYGKLSNCNVTLAQLNDSFKYNFDEIADIIQLEWVEKVMEV